MVNRSKDVHPLRMFALTVGVHPYVMNATEVAAALACQGFSELGYPVTSDPTLKDPLFSCNNFLTVIIELQVV